MKITTRFILTLSVFLLILIGMAVSLIVTNRQVERLDQQGVIANRIEQRANELSYLTGDYLMYGESQQRTRWEASFASLSKDVSDLTVQDPEQQAIVVQIESDRDRLGAVFEDVAGTIDRSAQVSHASPNAAFTQLSWSRTEVQVLAVNFEASQLSQKLRDQADRLKQVNLALMFSLIGIFGLYLLSNYYLMYKHTLGSIAELQTGTQIIGSGNLDFTIPVKRKDEIGKLSIAFNQMTASLKEVTASKTDLEREIAERKRAEQALRESQERLRITLASIGDAVLATDAQGFVTYLNPVAERLTGWPSMEAAGQSLEQVLPLLNEMTHQPAENPVMHVLQTGQVVGLGNHTALVARDGGVIPIEDSAAPIRDAEGSPVGVVLVFHDVTEKRRKELELVRLNRTLRALGRSSQAMLHLEDETSYLNEVCRIITQECGHAMVWIGYTEHDATKRVRPVAYAGFEAGYLDTLKITWADTERGRGPTGTAIRTGQVSLCRNMLTDPQFTPWRVEALKRGYASSIVLPILVEEKAAGALTIYSREPDPFSNDEIDLLTEIANDLAYGITTIRSHAAQEQAKLLQVENEQNRSRLEVQHRLLEQREQERLQIARDLHDGPVQSLTAVSLALQTLLIDGCPPGVDNQVEEIQTAVQNEIKVLRDYAGELRPPTLSRFGLLKAVQSHMATFMEKHPGLQLRLEKDWEGPLLPEEIRLVLFRIYQEGLTNITKHARATEATIRFRRSDQLVEMEIQDNGAGFEAPADWLDLVHAGHLGVVGMRERAEAIGGTLTIHSKPGTGAHLVVTVPLEKSDPNVERVDG